MLINRQQKAYIYAITAILFWSTVATAFKIALNYLNFIQLLFIACFVSIAILFVFLVIQKKTKLIFRCTKRQYVYSAAVGMLSPFAYYMVLLKAYSILPAQIAQPLNYTWPVMLVVLSCPLLKQKLTRRSLTGILCSFVGVVFISTQGNILNYKINNPLGISLSLSCSVIWALFWILNVRDKRDEIVKLLLNFIFGGICVFFVMIYIKGFETIDIRGIPAAIYVGFFELGIAFIFWMKAMQLTSSNDKISNLVFISPFLSLVPIHLILKENIHYTTLIGLSLIVTGIIIQQKGKKHA